jgi:hypothetical protein
MVIPPVLREVGYSPVIMFEQVRYNSFAAPHTVLGHIGQATLFVGNLSGHSQDVLLEVGAAWMAGEPMILMAADREVSQSELPIYGAEPTHRHLPVVF